MYNHWVDFPAADPEVIKGLIPAAKSGIETMPSWSLSNLSNSKWSSLSTGYTFPPLAYFKKSRISSIDNPGSLLEAGIFFLVIEYPSTALYASSVKEVPYGDVLEWLRRRCFISSIDTSQSIIPRTVFLNRSLVSAEKYSRGSVCSPWYAPRDSTNIAYSCWDFGTNILLISL